MATPFRLVLLNLVPGLWLVLVVQSASQNQRAQPLHWLALPVAIALAYAAFSFTFALGPLPMSPIVLALSLLAAVASIVCDVIDPSVAANSVARTLLVTAYLVWLAAFVGAVVSQWLRSHVPWPLAGNVDVAIVHVLMIAPLVVLFVAFFGSMAAGG